MIFRCGGHFYDESGDFKAGAASTTGCDWLLRTAAGKGIILDFSGLQSEVTPFSKKEPPMNCAYVSYRPSHVVRLILKSGKDLLVMDPW